MWGIIPAAGNGTRIQPLAFSKELLPVGSRTDGTTERPKAVSEYLVERFILAGVNKICFVIGPGKPDIVQYYSARVGGADIAFVVQMQAAGLCDAIFRASPSSLRMSLSRSACPTPSGFRNEPCSSCRRIGFRSCCSRLRTPSSSIA